MIIKVGKPSVKIISKVDGEEALKLIERAGRLCYHSEDKITDNSAENFVKARLAQGHEAIIEHYGFSALFICDRGVANEINRHRLTSQNMSSTRYINYTNTRHKDELVFIRPPKMNFSQSEIWKNACTYAAQSYYGLIQNGARPEIARSVLPLSLQCKLVVTANLREWRHFFKLRTDKAAHPQLRELATDLLNQCKEIFPIIFDDIKEGV